MESMGSGAASLLAEALFGSGGGKADAVWQEIRFDSPLAYLSLRRGEVVLEMLVSRRFCTPYHIP
jgi:hypothetical protein